MYKRIIKTYIAGLSKSCNDNNDDILNIMYHHHWIIIHCKEVSNLWKIVGIKLKCFSVVFHLFHLILIFFLIKTLKLQFGIFSMFFFLI